MLAMVKSGCETRTAKEFAVTWNGWEMLIQDKCPLPEDGVHLSVKTSSDTTPKCFVKNSNDI